MEISRRHLQETELRETRDVLVVGNKELYGQIETALALTTQLPKSRAAQIAEMRDHVEFMTGVDGSKLQVIMAEDQARATEMQREVDGMTRNQRRVLNKRMAKAAKKRK